MDMRVMIDINTQGAAFTADPTGELKRIFERVRRLVSNGNGSGVVLDSNGARVAEFERVMNPQNLTLTTEFVVLPEVWELGK